MADLQCHALVKKTGHRCKNVAATDGYCILHSKAFATATVAELPEFIEPATIDEVEVYDASNPDAGVTAIYEDGSFIAPFGVVPDVEPEPEPAPKVGFGAKRSEPTPRCRERSCFKVRGHGGRHENGSQSIATCYERKCRLPLGHPGEHGTPAKERVRIGELTGKIS